MRVLFFAAALYLIAPGHPDVPLAGLPLGQTGAALLILLIATLWWTRDVVSAPRAALNRAIVAVLFVKVVLALVAPQSGWLANYYANDRFAPPVEVSLDYRSLDATRIDRQLSFGEDQFPVHFFNNVGFNFGVKREVTEPFSVQWRGHLDAAVPITLDTDSRGDLEIAVDGQRADARPLTIPAGQHLIEVRYRKAANTSGALRVMPQQREWRIGEVMPFATTPWRRTLARGLAPIAWLLHVLALTLMVAGVGPAVVSKARTSLSLVRTAPLEGLHHWVMPVVLLGLITQGLWKSRALVDRVFTLSGGDDWWGFEASARDAIRSGWLMNGADPGQPFWVYPGYSYLVAAVHLMTGESLAGVILANFVALAVATLLVYSVARLLTTPMAAYVALAWLLLLEQLDFVRYYTVTLLSENLFLLLVAATVYLLIRYVAGGGWRRLIAAGLCGGLAAATRPTMMLYLPVAMVLLALAGWRAAGWRRAATGAVVLAVAWMAAVSPFTLRNYLVSGTPVLITSGQGGTFILYNLPSGTAEDKAKYTKSFDGSNLSGIRTLAWIFWDHPSEMLRWWGLKVAFSFGMVHWIEGIAPHPELVLTSLAYFAALLTLPSARALPAWLVHAFIATHLATLLLSVPWNYGYRMLLAMFLWMPIFAGALAARILERLLSRRGGRWKALAS